MSDRYNPQAHDYDDRLGDSHSQHRGDGGSRSRSRSPALRGRNVHQGDNRGNQHYNQQQRSYGDTLGVPQVFPPDLEWQEQTSRSSSRGRDRHLDLPSSFGGWLRTHTASIANNAVNDSGR
jgi:hypothetical protein